MVDYKIFYSWQNDAPDLCRTFIRGAVVEAIERLRMDDVAFDVCDVDRIDLDEGMKDISGSPEVASIMFEKIAESAIFVGDVTLVGRSKSEFTSAKQLPNANVLLEQGFAAAELGWERVICVMNEHFGTRDELPFDMKNRRFPINYTLAQQASQETRAKVRSELVEDFQRAIGGVREVDLRRAAKLFEKLDIHSFELAHFFSTADAFFQPAEEDRSQRIVALKDHEVFRQCILRFLDLGLIRTDAKGAKYAYHWTFHGKEVLKFVARAARA